MSSASIFRQLTAGLTFNTKRFKDDATKFGISKNDEKEKEDAENIPLPDLASIKVQVLNDARKKKEDSQNDSETEDIVLLGHIKSSQKKKKQKVVKKTKSKSKEIFNEKINQYRNSNKISVDGSDIPDPFDNWDSLKETYKISNNIVDNLLKMGFNSPTAIQKQTIPLMLESRELLATAPTGSGKTAAFLVPVIHHLKEPRKGGYRAIVVVPTKELASQINRECIRLCENTGLRSQCLGKVKSEKSSQVIVPKCDILITPPNRLVFMLQHDPPLVSLEKVEWLVVDEADKLFEAGVSGFREQLSTIYTSCSGPGVRRGMFSATLGPQVESWCRLNLDNMVKVRVGAANSATETIDQQLVYCGSEHGKLVAFRNLVRQGIQPPVLVFVQTKERAQDLFKELLYDGIHVDVIHADRSQQQRENTVRAFRSGGIWVLICTEVLGRGMDFKGVNLVINYDFPPTAVSYIHRIGRTGRAGRNGKAITFFTEGDRTILRTIAQVVKNSGCEVPEYMLHLKKPGRDERKKLAESAPKRDGITTESKYDQEKREKRESIISASKKRKHGTTESSGEPEVKSAKVDKAPKTKKKQINKKSKKDGKKAKVIPSVKQKKKKHKKTENEVA